MNPKVMLIAFIGVGLFGLFLFVRAVKPAALPPYPSFVNVYVAKRDLKAGSWINPHTDLTWKTVKWENHITGSVLTTQNIDRDVLRSFVPAGSFLYKRDLVAPGDSDFLTYAIHPGKVAVSLVLPIKNAVDHFIQPGEHVDVLMRNNGGRVAKFVLTNVLVLAVDRRLGREVKVIVSSNKGHKLPHDASQANGNANGGGGVGLTIGADRPDMPTVITLELTPEEAADLAEGMNKNGIISLALRSVLDNTNEKDLDYFLGPVVVYNGELKSQDY